MNKIHHEEKSENSLTPKLVASLVLAVLLIIVIVYTLIKLIQGKSVIPSSTNPTPTAGPVQTQQIRRFTAPDDIAWKTTSGKIYPFSFSYPENMILNIFIGDVTDSVAVVWDNIPVQQNILFNIEFVDKRDPEAVDKPKIEFVKNWYKNFSGLIGLERIEKFTNTGGLVGYKAIYINTAGQTPNTDVFFELPNRPTLMLHVANGIIDPKIFDRIVDSVRWTPETPATVR